MNTRSLRSFSPLNSSKMCIPDKGPWGAKHWLFVLFCSLQMKQNTVNTLCMSFSIYLACFSLLCLGNFHFVLLRLGNFDFVLLVNNKTEILGQDINASTARELCLSFNETASQRPLSTPLSYQPPNHSRQAGLSQRQHGPVAISRFISRSDDLLFHSQQ